MRKEAVLVLALAVCCQIGCSSSQEKPDNASWETRKGYKSLGHDDGGEVDMSGSRVLDTGGFDWSGVRHDLGINLAKAEPATCACLAVEVGSPEDEKFVWRGARPELRAGKLALAISAMKVDCPGAAPNPADRRPSIAAVDRKGKDVFVEIEEVPVDRPIASGAILNAVEPGGHIYVRPRGKNVPYGRPTGKELCRVK